MGARTVDIQLWDTPTRRTVVTTTVTKCDEVLVRYGINSAFRYEPPTDKHDEAHRGETWVPVDELRGRKGKRYYRFVFGHGDWADIPVREGDRVS